MVDGGNQLLQMSIPQHTSNAAPLQCHIPPCVIWALQAEVQRGLGSCGTGLLVQTGIRGVVLQLLPELYVSLPKQPFRQMSVVANISWFLLRTKSVPPKGLR